MSKTTDALKEAFAGESQANRKYLAFAARADQEGHKQAARLFRAAAEAETVHAHAHLKVLGGVQGTKENLAEAVSGETFEFTKMYPRMIEDAQAEGNKASSAASGSSKSDGGAEAMFNALDKNKDGSISKEEAAGTPHEKDFATLDKNSDGKLSKQEHAAAPEHSGGKAATGGSTSGDKSGSSAGASSGGSEGKTSGGSEGKKY